MKKFYLLLLLFTGIIGCKDPDDNNDNNDDTTKVGGWTVRKIADFQPYGQISAACDNKDKLHVVTAVSDEKLTYLTNVSGSWENTSLFECSLDYYIGAYSNVGVDNNNKVHVALHCSHNSFDEPDTKLYYITNKSGSFQTEVVPVSATPASGITILSKSDNIVHIFYGSLDMQVVYITNRTGSWTEQVIGNYWTSLTPNAAFDANGNIYVAIEQGYERVLRLAVINSGGELISNSVIDNTSSDTGWSPSIAISPKSGDIMINYWDAANEKLKLYQNGAISTVASCPWSEGNIIFDKNGNYYFTYFTVESLNMGSNASGEMQLTELPFTAVDRYSDVVVQSNGTVNIFFNDKSSYRLTMITK